MRYGLHGQGDGFGGNPTGFGDLTVEKTIEARALGRYDFRRQCQRSNGEDATLLRKNRVFALGDPIIQAIDLRAVSAVFTEFFHHRVFNFGFIQAGLGDLYAAI